MRDLLRNRNFLLYLLGNAISWLGTWAQRIGLGWLSWELTHRASWVGVVSFIQLLPLVIFGPVFGALLDRNDHRRYALIVNVILGLLATVLYLLTVLHLMSISGLCGMAFLLGIGNSAYQAARLTLVNDIVPADSLARAIALNSSLFNVTRAVGPAIAGVVMSRFGVATVFGINALSFLVIMAALAVMRLSQENLSNRRGGLAADTLDGIRYLLQHSRLRYLFLLSSATSTFGRGIVELFPAYADAVYGRGVQGLASFTAAAGAGAVAGALVMLPVPASHQRRVTELSTLVFGICVGIFGLFSSFAVAVALAGLIGFMVVLCSVGLQVQLQTEVPGKYRGRALGLWIVVNTAGPGLGGLLWGIVSQVIGLRTIALISGFLCVSLVVTINLLSRASARASGLS